MKIQLITLAIILFSLQRAHAGALSPRYQPATQVRQWSAVQFGPLRNHQPSCSEPDSDFSDPFNGSVPFIVGDIPYIEGELHYDAHEASGVFILPRIFKRAEIITDTDSNDVRIVATGSCRPMTYFLHDGREAMNNYRFSIQLLSTGELGQLIGSWTGHNKASIRGSCGDDAIIVSGSISGNDGDDFIAARALPSAILGGKGNDYIVGSDQFDLLFGNEGNDYIYSYRHNGDVYDTLVGGDGNDSLVVDDTSQESGYRIIGGEGFDTTNSHNDRVDGVETISYSQGFKEESLSRMDTRYHAMRQEYDDYESSEPCLADLPPENSTKNP